MLALCITYFIHWSHSSRRLSFALCQFLSILSFFSFSRPLFDLCSLRVQCRSAVAACTSRMIHIGWHKEMKWRQRYKEWQGRVRAGHTSGTPAEPRCLTTGKLANGKFNLYLNGFTLLLPELYCQHMTTLAFSMRHQ